MLSDLVIQHSNLIYSIVHSYKGYHSPEDLFQVGCIGLIKANENFDPSFGVKFTTFVYQYIWGEINKYVREDKGIKVSRTVNRINSQIERAYTLLSQINMRQPSIREVAKYLELPLEAVENALLSSNPLVSMDESFADEGKELTLHDSIPDRFSPDLDMLVALRTEISKLPQEDRDLINARYLMDMTQTETADSLGMSQVQVSRKEQKVLSMLRNRLD